MTCSTMYLQLYLVQIFGLIKKVFHSCVTVFVRFARPNAEQSTGYMYDNVRVHAVQYTFLVLT